MAYSSQSLKLRTPTFRTEIEEDFAENGAQYYRAKKNRASVGRGAKTSGQEAAQQAKFRVCGIFYGALTLIVQHKLYVNTVLNIR